MKLDHKILNPNLININKNNKILISIGLRCTSALAIKFSSLRECSFPFDWTIPLFPIKLKNILESNFRDFIPDVNNNIFINKYDIELAHFDKNIDNGIQQYKRRIKRFIEILNNTKHIYFVFINEDYLYNKNYRCSKFNKNLFLQMLELESYFKNNYVNLKFTILYFDFVKHEIPNDSNIINILISTDKLFNIELGSPYEEFREYCGKILSNLFGTKFISGYIDETFNE